MPTNPLLQRICDDLDKARRPEDIFGESITDAYKAYRKLARQAHPDKYIEDDVQVATELMARINVLWKRAQDRIESNVYGQAYVETLRTKSFEIALGLKLRDGDICTQYDCQFSLIGDVTKSPGIVKISLDPKNNDLVQNEAAIVRELRSHRDDERYFPFISNVVDSFMYSDEANKRTRHQANLLAKCEGFYSLEEVAKEYPNGLDPRDMAWMFRRLLIALYFTHKHDIVHGAVTPAHVLIHPEQHGLTLVDWSYAVKSGQPLKAVVPVYRSYYPPEVFAKQPTDTTLDICMAARTMVRLLDPGLIGVQIPTPLRAFFRACTLPDARLRPRDAGKLLEDFDELIDKMWPRRFRPFSMPAVAS